MLVKGVAIILGLAAAHGCWRMARHENPSLIPHVRRWLAWLAFHAKARVFLGLAKCNAQAACSAVIDQRFTIAARRLDQAIGWMRRVDDDIPAHPRYNRWADHVNHLCRHAAVGLRENARLTIVEIDRVLAASDRSASIARHAGAHQAGEADERARSNHHFNPSQLKAA